MILCRISLPIVPFCVDAPITATDFGLKIYSKFFIYNLSVNSRISNQIPDYFISYHSVKQPFIAENVKNNLATPRFESCRSVNQKILHEIAFQVALDLSSLPHSGCNPTQDTRNPYAWEINP